MLPLEYKISSQTGSYVINFFRDFWLSEADNAKKKWTVRFQRFSFTRHHVKQHFYFSILFLPQQAGAFTDTIMGNIIYFVDRLAPHLGRIVIL